ncbi:unnamed protein product [Strongylus vulgaris]|uniref:SCP domain-containing protein n=1 Tax=Strongylus vulgaris TaxID=40348 RepID=A0A3P7J9T4_STRVU|nr:unnamed protein product [Strongylus vulgaris]
MFCHSENTEKCENTNTAIFQVLFICTVRCEFVDLYPKHFEQILEEDLDCPHDSESDSPAPEDFRNYVLTYHNKFRVIEREKLKIKDDFGAFKAAFLMWWKVIRTNDVLEIPDMDIKFSKDLYPKLLSFSKITCGANRKVGCAVQACNEQKVQVACAYEHWPEEQEPLYLTELACERDKVINQREFVKFCSRQGEEKMTTRE